MKKIFWVGLAMMMSACHEDIMEDNGIRGDNVMQLSAEIQQQYITRANDGGFANGDEIGVFIVNYQDETEPVLQATGNHADNVRFTYNEETGKWTGSYQLYWKDKKTPVDAYGYYPFDAELSSTTAYQFSVQKNQHDNMKTGRKLSGYEASDFLWAKQKKVVPTTGLINLQHHHLMAGIKVKLVEGIGFDEGEWDEIQKTVLIENTILQSSINMQTGTVSLISNGSVQSILPQQSGNIFRAVVIPQTVSADKSLLSITIDNKTYRPTRNEEMVYYPGKLHNFTYEVQKSLETGDYQFSLISESITPWENDPESHNGTAKEYVVLHMEAGTVLEDLLKEKGLRASQIENLKITGTLDDAGRWGYLNNFEFMRDSMPNLHALNLKECRVMGRTGYYESNWVKDLYGSEDAYDGNQFEYVIPYKAFENMHQLRYFVFPDTLRAIGEMAFAGSHISGSLILPEGLKYIGRDAFVAYGHDHCLLTGELYIPSSVEYIGDNAFGSYDDLHDVYFTNELILPEKLKYLGGGAFTGCRFMTGTVRIPDGLKEVGGFLPVQISGPAVIPQGVKKVNGVGGGITSLYLPEGVEEIGWGAFWGCSKMQGTLRMPSTMKTIGENAFIDCAISHLELNEGLEIVNVLSFAYCRNMLDTLRIPSTVTQIRARAFQECSQLTALILPANLQGIQDDAFAGCYSLDYIECLAVNPPEITGSTFSGVEKNNFTLIVPKGSVEAYKNAPHWCEFKRISSDQKFVCRPMKAKLLNKSNVRELVINADTNWEMVSCPSWIHLSKTSGYKKTELQVTIDAMPHNQGDREGKVVFQLDRLDDEGQPITCEYLVQQFDYEYEEDGVIPMQKATKGNRGGIDILFVGDGYDAEDIARGTYLTVMQQQMEYFFAVEPYLTYKDYFNVSTAVAMSYESGIHDNPDLWRQPKFNTTYGVEKNGRLGFDFLECMRYVLEDVEQCPVTSSNVDRSLIIAVPNANAYEGVTMLYGSGAAIAVCPYFESSNYPYDARGIVQHEAGGHGFGKFDDEYIYHRKHIDKCGCDCCTHSDAVLGMKSLGWARNVSLNGKYKTSEWRHLIFDSRYSDIVDIYDGSHMHSDGIYRSEVNSCMNNNVPYFSTVSRQAIVERIKDYAGETFDFEDFVAHDSREMGDKFLTRGGTPWQEHKYSEHHGVIIRNGSPLDYLKKKGGKR